MKRQKDLAMEKSSESGGLKAMINDLESKLEQMQVSERESCKERCKRRLLNGVTMLDVTADNEEDANDDAISYEAFKELVSILDSTCNTKKMASALDPSKSGVIKVDAFASKFADVLEGKGSQEMDPLLSQFELKIQQMLKRRSEKAKLLLTEKTQKHRKKLFDILFETFDMEDEGLVTLLI